MADVQCFQFGAKFSNPGLGLLRKETRENSGFEINAILSDEISISL